MKTLNRELAAHLIPRNLEEVNKEILDYVRKKVAEKIMPIHKVYRDIGKWLVSFNEIGECELMAELHGKFARLGRDVVLVSLALGDSGLVDEEFLWLGSFSISYRNAGGETFEFVPSVAELDSIQDCSPQERTLLYMMYLRGMRSGFLTKEKFFYGAAFSRVEL